MDDDEPGEAIARAIDHAVTASGLRFYARTATDPDDFRALITAAKQQSRAAREALAEALAGVR